MTPDQLKDLAAQFGTIVSAVLGSLYVIDQAIKRLWPPGRRGYDRPSKDLVRIADTLHQVSVSLQHTTVVQDEIASHLRDFRQRDHRITETLARIETKVER
jgi:hypothetical protein